jgi:hypothetical protein
MNDLWPNFSQNEIEDNKAIDILREQARTLEKKTNGKVKATFSKIEYKGNLASITENAGKIFAPLCLYAQEEILDEELRQKKDFNELYKLSKYKFEIFNDSYRFRLFTLNYREVYPVDLILDEGIRSELTLSSSCSLNVIEGNSELENLLMLIFSSNKVKTVIGRMMKETNT